LNLRSYLQITKKLTRHSLLLQRYYFDTKYDYVTVLTGYGSSPDESLFSRLRTKDLLNSYRIGAGYFKQFGNQFITGAQIMINHQEYIAK
jgi:hypothetical protein